MAGKQITRLLAWLAMAVAASAFGGGGASWMERRHKLAKEASYASSRARAPTAPHRGLALRMSRRGEDSFSEQKRLSRDAFLKLGACIGLMFLEPSPPVGAKTPKKTVEEVAATFRQLLQAQATIEQADGLVQRSDWKGVRKLFQQDEIKNIERLLLDLVNGPVVTAEDKKTIGTRKRYGIAADVIYGIDGVISGIDSLSTPQVENCSGGTCSGELVDGEQEIRKSFKNLKASLSEIVTICRAYKEFKRILGLAELILFLQHELMVEEHLHVVHALPGMSILQPNLAVHPAVVVEGSEGSAVLLVHLQLVPHLSVPQRLQRVAVPLLPVMV
eukprot:761971-Hanusia_phi.AAC.2